MFKRSDHAVVHRFAIACRSGSVGALSGLLAPEVVAVSDGGGQVAVALDPVRGPGAVARCVTGLTGPDVTLTVESVNGDPGVVVRNAGRVVAVVSLRVAGAKVTAEYPPMNPADVAREGLAHLPDGRSSSR